MKFNETYKKLISEISQSKINNALRQSSEFKDRNPIAKQRYSEVLQKWIDRSRSKGFYINGTKDKNSTMVTDLKHYIITKAIKGEDDELLRIEVVETNEYEDEKNYKTELIIIYKDYSMKINERRNQNYNEPFYLNSRKDAENLTKFIYKETGIRIPWKNLDFVHISDSYVSPKDEYFDKNANEWKTKKNRYHH